MGTNFDAGDKLCNDSTGDFVNDTDQNLTFLNNWQLCIFKVKSVAILIHNSILLLKPSIFFYNNKNTFSQVISSPGYFK